MVGSDACGSTEEATSCDSAEDCGAEKAVLRVSDGFTSPWLIWLNKAVPVNPCEFRSGGNVFDCLQPASEQ